MPDGQYRDIINNSVINPQVPASTGTFAQRERGDILIIAANEFMGAVDRLALWKRQMGFNVTIEAKAAWTSDEIEAHITSLTSNPPDYVILFGDHDNVASKIRRNYSFFSDSYYYTDSYYFSNYNSTPNSLPHSATARISVNTLSEAYNVVDKIIAREKQPPTKSEYYTNILTASLFEDSSTTDTGYDASGADGYEDRSYTRTIWEIGEYLTSKQGKQVDRLYYFSGVSTTPTNWNNTMFHYGDPIPSSLLTSGVNWNPTGSNHVEALNNGRIFGFYRGHGDEWGVPGNFSISDVTSLNNSSVLPVLFFTCCSSGSIYQYSPATDITSITEKLLRKPDGGAVGILAASFETLPHSNDAFAKSLVNAMWPNPGIPVTHQGIIDYKLVSAAPKPMDKIGYIILQGHIQSNQVVKNDPLSLYQYYGDPSMDIDLDPPSAISVAMSDTVDIKNGSYNVHWSSLTEGIVTLTVGNNVISSSEITSNGTASLDLPSDLVPLGSTKPATITITGKHCRPLIKNVTLTNN
ncbi:MAG: Gingipain R1 precursor [Firmicutes bacterium ADurb.Bin419]|nr:MAG: Gingipain R1 precursor [Firmicutes bacterium ADurb.Bin419]